MEPVPLPPEPPLPPFTDVEPPDFATMFAQQARGVKKGGMWDDLWKGLEYWSTTIIGGVLGFLLMSLSKVVIFIVGILIRSKDETEGSVMELAGKVADATFGAAERGESKRGAMAAQVGNVIINALFPAGSPDPLGGVRPSSDAAAKYLATMLGINLDLWIEGMLADALTVHELEQFGSLKELLSQSLGFGRLTRRALAAPMKILVEEPFAQLLNSTYRPTLLAPGEAVLALQRGLISADEFTETMKRHGYTDKRMELLVAKEERHLGLADLDYLVSRGMMDEENAIKELTGEGWDRTRAAVLLKMEESKRMDRFREEAAQQITDHYAVGDISEAEFLSKLRGIFINEREIAMRHVVGIIRSEVRRTPLSIGDLSAMVERGILGIKEFEAGAKRLGYDATDELHLELLLLHKVADKVSADRKRSEREKEQEAEKQRRAQERAKHEADAAARAKLGGVNLAEEKSLVERGIRTLEEYAAFLRTLGMSEDAVLDLVAEMAEGIARRKQAEKERADARATAKVKHISLAQTEKAVIEGTLAPADLDKQLAALGFEEESRARIVELVVKEAMHHREDVARREKAQEKADTQHLALSQLIQSARLGVMSAAEVDAALSARGFTVAERDVIARDLALDLARDKEARAQRDEARRRASEKGASLQDLEHAFRRGISDEPKFRAQLTKLGFTPEAVDLEVRLVLLEIAADKAARDARAQAEEKRKHKTLSLADVERAVLLGVTTIDTFTAMLEREGFDAPAREVMRLTLLARVAQIQAARKKRADAEARAKEHGLSLAQDEALFRRGEISRDAFLTRALAIGLSSEDAGELADLVEDEIAEHENELKARTDARKQLQARKVSLSKLEMAVTSGLLTESQFRATLEAQGLDAEQIDLVVDLLESKQAPAPAKPTKSKA